MQLLTVLFLFLGCNGPLELRAFVDVDRSGARSCGVTAEGEAYCWDRGERALSWTVAPDSNYLTLFDFHDAVGIATREHDVCVLREGGLVSCLAFNGVENSLGYGDRAEQIDGLGGFEFIDAGPRHYCGITTEGGVSCWGEISGTLWGDQNLFTAPQSVPDIEKARKLSLGQAHSCAVQKNGEVRCWGDPDWGRLGASTNGTVLVEGLERADGVAVGQRHSCATVDGELWCWGHEPVVVGGAVTPPVRIDGIDQAVDVGSADAYTCAVRSDGSSQCIQRNDDPERTERWAAVEPGLTLGEPGRVLSNAQSICTIDKRGALACLDGRL